MPTQPTEFVDDVTCSVDTPSVDPDGDAITYVYTWLDANQSTLQTSTTTGILILCQLVKSKQGLTCDVEVTDGSATGISSTTITVQTAGGQHVVLTGTPDPSTVFDHYNIERTYFIRTTCPTAFGMDRVILWQQGTIAGQDTGFTVQLLVTVHHRRMVHQNTKGWFIRQRLVAVHLHRFLV